MNEGKGNRILLTIVAIATLLVAVVGATFAYFTAVLGGQESAATVKVISGSIGTVFEGGSTITVLDIFPRAEVWATKTFTIKHTNDVVDGANVAYNLAVVVDENTFTPGDLKYTFLKDVSSSTNGGFATDIATQTNIPSTGSINLGSGYFDPPTGGEVTHKYNFNIYFPDSGVSQDESQGKSLKAHVTIIEG
ncbi:MAG: hypothetical protein PHD03_01415 [Bacilli bacterium]|nr:hypothetical protein [Bacilli bacterium]MDD4406905.1 hypothetical protein [Bacilli bacterium]